MKKTISVSARFFLLLAVTLMWLSASAAASGQKKGWYAKVRDSYRNVETVPGLVKLDNAVVTRRDDTLFVHFPRGLDADGVDLGPLNILVMKQIAKDRKK